MGEELGDQVRGGDFGLYVVQREISKSFDLKLYGVSNEAGR